LASDLRAAARPSMEQHGRLHGRVSRMSQPYTHADHARKCVVAAYRGQSLALKVQYVQARIGRTVCCARIVTAWDTADGVEMWQLDLQGPIHGRMSAPARNVRQCQGIDGTCSCAPADPVMQESAALRGPACGDTAGASALPDGNHGEIIPELAQ
jgi:hypothetical protein